MKHLVVSKSKNKPFKISQLKKQVRTPLYRQQIVDAKRGKGSYSRSKIKLSHLIKGLNTT